MLGYVAQNFVRKNSELFSLGSYIEYFINAGLFMVFKTVFNETLSRSPVLVILHVKRTPKLYKRHSLIKRGILMSVLLTPLLSVEY